MKRKRRRGLWRGVHGLARLRALRAPWFQWAGCEQEDYSLYTAETAMPPSSCGTKSNFKEIMDYSVRGVSPEVRGREGRGLKYFHA